jgi:hypothetical protein
MRKSGLTQSLLVAAVPLPAARVNGVEVAPATV